jgi:hypothetical protein
MISEDAWATVERLQHEWSAEITRGRLEAEGIPAVLRGNKAAGAMGAVNELNTSWSNPLGGVEVRVLREDVARAKEVLSQGDESPIPPRPTPQWIQWCVAFWIASLFFYSVVGLTDNISAGFISALAAFGALLWLGKRRSI